MEKITTEASSKKEKHGIEIFWKIASILLPLIKKDHDCCKWNL